MRVLYVPVFGSKLWPGLAVIRLGGQRSKMIGLRNLTSSSESPFSKMVILEGNIGVGKTTLACRLGRELDYRVMLEPTAKNPYLAKFYKDPKSYALKLQLWIFRQRFAMYVEALKHLVETGQGVIMDRSVFSDTVFADVNYHEGTISPEGYTYYQKLKYQALKNVPVPDVILYLGASPQTCYERICKRSRDYESGIPINYLEGLDKAYTKFVIEMKKLGSEVFSYDWSHFGYKYEVAKDVQSVSSREWGPEAFEECKKLIYSSLHIKKALTLNYTIPEATVSEGEDEHHTLQECEKKQHLQEFTKQKIGKNIQRAHFGKPITVSET